jgi:predicted RNase H-like HicB family nuclease
MPESVQIVKVKLHLEPQEDGTIVAWVPELPGCVTDGHTLEEVKQRAIEAISLYLEDLIACGEPIPEGISLSEASQTIPNVEEIEFPLAVGA